jgi:hypothetical protein
MKPFLSWLLTVTALAVVLIAAFLLVSPARTVAGPAEGEIATRILNLRTIAATEYRYRDVIYFGEESRFLGILAGSRRILFSVTISVTAGVDMNHGVDVQFDPDNRRTVYVTLPSPEVIRVDAEERSISQYFVQDRLGRIDWLSVSDEVEAAKERNRRDAVERGILSQAEVQARAAVERLLQAGGFSAVHVRFRPASEGITG